MLLTRSQSLSDLSMVTHPQLMRSHSAPSLGASIISVAASSEQPEFDSVDGRIKFKKFKLEIMTPAGKGHIDINKEGSEISVALGVEVAGFGGAFEVGVEKQDKAPSDERPTLTRQNAKDRTGTPRAFIHI
ncbi:MAG: hypothetical protein ACRCRU_00335 [Vibrio sp.]|uniref:hypothetical protein n=1 Tax=Vibrio sp. TaxID=678 RepID=UPI003F30B24B